MSVHRMRAQAPATFFVVLISLWLFACGGGTQQATDGTGTQAVDRGDVADTPRGPRGPTPEEEEAVRAERARTLYEEAVRSFEDYTSESRDVSTIRGQLEEVTRLAPDHAPAWFNLGVLEQEAGNLDAARSAYRRAGEVDETFARGLANLGYLALTDGDDAAARAYFEQCLSRRPLEAGCNINLAVLYRLEAMESGTFGDMQSRAAIERLRTALGGEARNAEAYATLARIYFDLGRPQLARLVCENAILLGIRSAALHNRLGLIALSEDNVIEAYREFQRAIAIDPDYSDARMNIGAMALSFRDYATAGAAFERVLADQPGNVDVLLSHGVALRGLDDLEGAQSRYREVLDASPGHMGALFNLAILYQEGMQDYSRARDYFVEFLQAGGAQHPMAAEARQRLEVLEELIELMEGTSRRP